jgi:hypothetical protein
MSGGPLPPNCVVMTVPFQQAQAAYPTLLMGQAASAVAGSGNSNGGETTAFAQQGFYGQTPVGPFMNTSQGHSIVPYPAATTKNYNYPTVSHKNRTKSKNTTHHQPHSNVYNSSSFDTYMHNLSWSRLFDHHQHQHNHSRKSSKQDSTPGNVDQKSNSLKKPRADSTDSSTSSTTSDETIRRVNVANQQTTSTTATATATVAAGVSATVTAGAATAKLPTKGSLPFKYSSEFVPGLDKQQLQNGKSRDVSQTKKA